jgi:hypothetical protein
MDSPVHQYPKNRTLPAPCSQYGHFLDEKNLLSIKKIKQNIRNIERKKSTNEERKEKRKQIFKIIYFFPLPVLASFLHSTQMGRLWMSYITWSTNNFKQLKHFNET